MTDQRATLLNADNVGDLLTRLGGVSAHRIRLRPAPGMATESDLLEIERRENRLCELIDGVLVEKAMGYRESLIAAAPIRFLGAFVVARNAGLVSGSDGMMRLFPGLVRVPDVAFVSWARLPGRKVPVEAIPSVVPDLVVEVLSPGNTAGEMARKREEYFSAGVRLLWSVDPLRRTTTVYISAESGTERSEADTLDGGDVLPGFHLPLHELFAELDRQA